jgi:DNA end-binding protein Ku
MARPTWRGSIGFGLVNVPVRLFTAVRSHDVHFTQLHEDTHARVRRRRVDEETGEEADQDAIVKGYEVADGRYVVIDPEELAELDPAASRTIDIHDFVDLAEIDPIYYDRAYYLLPDGDQAAKAYKLLTDAMAGTDRVAIGTFVMRTKQYLAAIRASEGVLLLSTMHYADEVADPTELDIDAAIGDVEVADREAKMAKELIESMTASFDPEAYRDEHQERIMELIQAKAEGEELPVEAPQEDVGGVVDLMSALERSLEGARSDGQAGSSDDRDYDAMSKGELYELAQEQQVPGRSSMSKEELADALRGETHAKAS